MEISETATTVLDSLYRKGDDWTMFEIMVHSRTWGYDPFPIRDEVERMIEEGQLSLLDTGFSTRIAGWKPRTEEHDALQLGRDAEAEEHAGVGNPTSVPQLPLHGERSADTPPPVRTKKRGGSYDLPPRGR
jgi:hypothetical protein